MRMGNVVMVGLVVVFCCTGSGWAANSDLNTSAIEGLTVTVLDSKNCNGTTDVPQVVTATRALTGGVKGGCPYRLAVTVTGLVETQNAAFDFVYVNDVLFFSGDEAGGGCVMGSKTMTKEIEVNAGDEITITYDTADELFHTGGYATITKVDVVGGGCADCTYPGSGHVKLGSVDVELSLGKAAFGSSAGILKISEETPSPQLATPQSLRFAGSSAYSEVIKTGTVLRQVKAPETFVDIVTVSATGYEIRFYPPSVVGQKVGGIYQLIGQPHPFVTWIVENPDATGASQTGLRVTEVRDQSSLVNEYTSTGGKNWDLVKAGGAVRESFTTGSDAVAKTTTETRSVFSGAVLVAKTATTWKDFAWGTELLETVEDPDTSARRTTRTYYANSATDGVNYTKLKQIVNPDGGWERYEYDADGHVTKLVTPFLDAAVGAAENLCRVTTTTYQAAAPQETRIAKVLGVEVDRSYRVYQQTQPGPQGVQVIQETRDIQTQTTGAAYDAPDNLVTVTRKVASGPFTGELDYVVHPDSNQEWYQYAMDGANRVTTLNDLNSMTVTKTDPAGHVLSKRTESSGFLLSEATAIAFDDAGRPTTIQYDDGTAEVTQSGCCGPATTTDRNGLATSFKYDDLGFLSEETRGGITTVYTNDPVGRVVATNRRGSDDSIMSISTSKYDVAGRLYESADASGRTTKFAATFDANGHPVRTTTYPDLSTRIETFALDGSLLSVDGTAVHPLQYQYGVDQDGLYTKEIRVGLNGATTEWTKTSMDAAGRTRKIAFADGSTSQFFFNTLGQLAREVDPDGVTILHQYGASGPQTITAVDVNRNGVIDYGGPDRVTQVIQSVAQRAAVTVKRTETLVYSDAGQISDLTETSPNGRNQWRTVGGNTTATAVTAQNGAITTTETSPDNSYRVSVTTADRPISESRYLPDGTVLSSRSFGYDPHGRQATVTDENGVTTTVYNADDRLASITTPVPGAGYAAQTTSYGYDWAGRKTTETLPDSGVVNTAFWPSGELKHVDGARTYTADYTYDPQGRIKTLVAGGSTTTWNYSAVRGWLDSKIYADNKGTTYTHTAAGRLWTRTWQRGVITTYSYTSAGDLQGIDYSDGTPDVEYQYDRVGNVNFIRDAEGVRHLTYRLDGQLGQEDHTNGYLGGISLVPGYDALQRRNALQLQRDGAAFLQQSFGFDEASRLSSASQDTTTATYGYGATETQVATITFSEAGTPTAVTTHVIDKIGRLQSTTTTAAVGGAVLAKSAYDYNAANLRTRQTLADGTYWSYSYDGLGQLTFGGRNAADGTPLPGEQFGYGFDAIGNRLSTTTNGRAATYTPNNLNQYTGRTVPGAADLIGSSAPNVDVVVNGQAADRSLSNLRWSKTLTLDNSAGPIFAPVHVEARSSGTTNVLEDDNGSIFLPPAQEAFRYDLDGNLLEDGRWLYNWDGENRLQSMEARPSVPLAGRSRLEFVYDEQGRRVVKRGYRQLSDGMWSQISESTFVYDGWNLIAELDANRFQRFTFLWGMDVSGTIQRAGGVGGLLVFTTYPEGGNNPAFSPLYDGDGNVVAMMSSGQVSASFGYGPFGEPTQVSGLLVAAMESPVRWSTKYVDREGGNVYYGHRYYEGRLGRWLNRDLIDENESQNANPYLFCLNAPTAFHDPSGLDPLGVFLFRRYTARHGMTWFFGDEWLGEDTVSIRDTYGLMAKSLGPDMDAVYLATVLKLERDNQLPNAGFVRASLSNRNVTRYGTWHVNEDRNTPFLFDVGFYLGTAQDVRSLGGTFEVRCVNKGRKVYEVKNTFGSFVWADRIDSNIKNSDNASHPIRNPVETVNHYLEGGAPFQVRVYWEDRRSQARNISP